VICGLFPQKKISETKHNLVSNNHTTVNNNMNNMKTNIETNITTATNSMQTPGISRRGAGLKAVVIILSVTALCLSYRAANEAVALYGVLDKVQATLANEQSMQAQAAAHVQISETKTSVAGL
jgi:hypothetical protein